MELIFLDTSFLFAFFNRTDRYHRKAHHFFQDIISQQQVGWVYTDYIFDELLTLILIRN